MFVFFCIAVSVDGRVSINKPAGANLVPLGQALCILKATSHALHTYLSTSLYYHNMAWADEIQKVLTMLMYWQSNILCEKVNKAGLCIEFGSLFPCSINMQKYTCSEFVHDPTRTALTWWWTDCILIFPC